MASKGTAWVLPARLVTAVWSSSAASSVGEASRDGVLTPDAVVTDASAEDSPLHPHFEWDNARAAHAYRVDQARELIRVRSVNIERPDGGSTRVNAWVNLDPGPNGKRGYMPTVDALADPVRRQVVLDRARQEMNAWVDRYRHLQEAASILAESLRDMPAA